MSRPPAQALEDLSTQYDISVRNSSGMIVQFRYGDDGLDPANMEDENRPVDFARVLTHCQVRRQRRRWGVQVPPRKRPRLTRLALPHCATAPRSGSRWT